MGYQIIGIQDSKGNWKYKEVFFEDIQKLKTDFLNACIRLYNDFTTFKILPHGKGTLDENEVVLQILRICTEEANKYERYQREMRN